jgi:hypothetical protein
MLAEKFFLYLETLIESRKAYADGSPRVVSESPHVPIRLPAANVRFHQGSRQASAYMSAD